MMHRLFHKPFVAASFLLSFCLSVGGSAGIAQARSSGVTAPAATSYTVTQYQSITFTSDYGIVESDGVQECHLDYTWSGGSGSFGSMALSTPVSGSNGTATITTYFEGPAATTFTLTTVCGTAAIRSPSVVVTVTADTAAPHVSTLTPLTATVGVARTFSATYSDAGSGVSECLLGIQSMTTVPATLAGPAASGSVTAAYTFSSPGTYGVSFTCADRMGNWSPWAYQDVVVSAAALIPPGITLPPGVLPVADTIPPTASIPTPLTATVGVAQTFSSSYADAGSGVASCSLYLDGSTITVPATRVGTPASGTMTASYTFSTTSGHDASFGCVDVAGNATSRISFPVTVSPAVLIPPGITLPPGVLPVDTTPPTVTAVSPLTATAGASRALSFTYSDAGSGVTSCGMTVDSGTSVPVTRTGTGASGTVTASYVFSAGSHTVATYCTDARGNTNTYVYATVVASVPSSGSTGDTFAPVVATPASISVSVNQSTGFNVMVTEDSSGLNSCYLFINGMNQGVMALTGTALSGNAAGNYTFVAPGSYAVRVECLDNASNRGVSGSGNVTVTGGSSTGSGSSSTILPGMPTPGTLAKVVCPAGARADHPCKAVYYYGRDGKRHAFPNEHVYFTWYSNFSGVSEVSASVIASIPLGMNVTYRPGVKLVKFTTLDHVYAVSRGGTLRWVTSEPVAVALYGSAWNRRVDDIADTFFLNYRFGTDITSASQYSPTSETASVASIDDNF